jgi:hypothetical protein
MGHLTVLVIGDKFRDQLYKYQCMEYAPLSRHIVAVDILELAKTEVLANVKNHRPLKGCETIESRLLDWAKSFGFPPLAEGQVPDILKTHRYGWMRNESDGKICELVQRTVPGAFLDWFEDTDNLWKLKHGATGVVISGKKEELATDGFAGSARKCDIDLEGMRYPIDKAAGDWWDCAKNACNSMSWERFGVIWERHQKETYNQDDYDAAMQEWAAQPAIQAIIEASRLNKPSYEHLSEYKISFGVGSWNKAVTNAIDLLRLSRKQYLDRHGLRFLLRYSYVIKDGQLLEDYEEEQLYASIPEEAVLTLACVHA